LATRVRKGAVVFLVGVAFLGLYTDTTPPCTY
jgi:hypothetical protein